MQFELFVQKHKKKRNAPKSHIKLAFLYGIHYLIKCVMCGMARHVMSMHCTLLLAYQKANSKMNQVTLLWSYHKNAILQKVHACTITIIIRARKDLFLFLPLFFIWISFFLVYMQITRKTLVHIPHSPQFLHPTHHINL